MKRTLDIIVILYFIILSLIGIFAINPINNVYIYVIIHIIIVISIFFIYNFRNCNSILYFLSHFYPYIFFTFMYEEVSPFLKAYHNGFIDKYIYDFEFHLFGIHPTQILDRIVFPVVTEIFKFTYHSYYYLVLIPAFILYFKKREKEFFIYTTTLSLAFYLSYIGFIIFPVEGPRYTIEALHFNKMPFPGYFFTAIQDLIMKKGSLHGGCMPSSHVACALVSVMMIKRYFSKKIFILIFIDFIFLSISTVYCRYHYFSDVIAGIFVGIISIYFINYLYKTGKFRY